MGHGIAHGHGHSMDARWPRRHLGQTERCERSRLEGGNGPDAGNLTVRADMGWSLEYSHLLWRTGWKQSTSENREDRPLANYYWIGLDG
jgi:hypothetical protein